MIELVPASYSAPDRPAVLYLRDGAKIYLHVKDAEYMRLRADWRRKLAAAHPDHGGTNERFRRTRQQQQKWLYQQATEYARLGILPPDGFSKGTALDAMRARNRRALLPVNPQLSEPETEA